MPNNVIIPFFIRVKLSEIKLGVVDISWENINFLVNCVSVCESYLGRNV